MEPSISEHIRAMQTAHIHALANRLTEAFNRHSAADFAACFTANAAFINIAGRLSEGRNGIAKAHAPLFASEQMPGVPSFKNAILAILDLRVRPVRSDVAAVDITWKQTGALAPDGQPWPERRGVMVMVAAEQQGEWLFEVCHNMDVKGITPDNQ